VSLSFAVVCEAAADREIACKLADRVVCAEIQWIEGEHLDHLRVWRGEEVGEDFLVWTQIKDRYKEKNLPPFFGHFNGEPAKLDADSARKALVLLKTCQHLPDAVILVRDADDRPERKAGLQQARDLRVLGDTPILVGLAVSKRECWVVAGFDPESPDEEDVFKGVRQDLGFDPRFRAEDLSAKDPLAKKSAKRVLELLCGGDRNREAKCWEVAPLERLVARGQNSGLADYLEEVRQRIAPLFWRKDS
jgi:hypothetical protein